MKRGSEFLGKEIKGILLIMQNLLTLLKKHLGGKLIRNGKPLYTFL